MNLKPVLLLCAAAVPTLALADLSATPPSSLGIVHAVLNACAKLDPGNRSDFTAEWTSIVGSELAVERTMEHTTAYQLAYKWMIETLETTPRGELAKICAVRNHSSGDDDAHEPDHDHDHGDKLPPPAKPGRAHRPEST